MVSEKGIKRSNSPAIYNAITKIRNIDGESLVFNEGENFFDNDFQSGAT